MISVALLLLFIAFNVFYNTSEKAIKNIIFGFENWVKKNKKIAKLLAFILLVIACVLLSFSFGLGAGVLVFFIVLMTFGSLIVLLTPINFLNLKSIFILFVILLCTEFFIFK